MEAFGDALRLELAHRGVTVGTAHPIWVDTDLVRDAQADLPIFRRQLAQARGPLATQGVDSCARLLVRGIETRQAKVFVPPLLRGLFHLRTLSTTAPGSPPAHPRGGALRAEARGGGAPARPLVRRALDSAGHDDGNLVSATGFGR